MNEGEGVGSEGEGVAIWGFQEEDEAAVLGGDVVDVGGEAEDLKDPTPVTVLVIDSCLAGEECVNQRQEQIRHVRTHGARETRWWWWRTEERVREEGLEVRDECWDLLRCTIKMKCMDSLLYMAPLDDAMCGSPCQIRCARAFP